MNKHTNLKKAVKHYSFDYTKSKEKKLMAVALKYKAFRNEIFNKYGSLECLPYLSYPRKLRNQWITDGSCKKYGLQSKQWQIALEEVFYVLTARTEQWKKIVKRDIKKNKKLSDEEKHYLFSILCSYNLIYDICKNREIRVFKDFQIASKRKIYLHRYLHTLIRTKMGPKPKSHSLSFSINTDMYNIKQDKKGKNWIAITTLTFRKMIHISLTDNKPIKGQLIIKILKNHIEIIETQEVPCKRLQDNTSDKIIAIDKGLTNLINASTNTKYGQGFGKSLSEFSDRRTDKNSTRNKLREIYNVHLINHRFKKAANILKYNLGKIKYNHIKNTERKELEQQINAALNQFFKFENPHELVVEKLDFQSWTKKLNRNQRRHFSAWLKGYLQERIEFKCQQNGVLLAEINSAYTSQLCPFCGFVHSDNRRGANFHCLNCGREGDADYFASLNILSRLTDSDIGLFTPYREVKKILMERFEAGRICEPQRLRLSNPETSDVDLNKSATRRANNLVDVIGR